ncbi:MAG: aminoacyl-tRNA hydrolase [Burkholderiales bacterium]|nr:aminoacyl-tRNA hydrolase [Burkholderiales bacterium]
MTIKLIVGLGNVGREYEDTRHNAGFWLVDAYARASGIALRQEKHFFGSVGKGAAVWLVKPSTFMNRSGQSVAALATFYKILPAEILVAHDELDLPPGAVKMKQGGGHAGHNGLKDIAARLGSPDFWRIRIGIGHPRELSLEQDVADFVLHRPSKDHQVLIDEAIAHARDVLPYAIEGPMGVATMKLHTRKKA